MLWVESRKWLTSEEANMFLKFVPVILGDEMVVKIFKEEGCGLKPKSSTPCWPGSQELQMMSTLWREGGKGFHGPDDGYHTPPVGTFWLYFIWDYNKPKWVA